MFIRYFLISISLLATLYSCEKPARDNPWDETATLNPSDWAPQDFQIEDVSITEKKLTWTYDDKNIEGFKLDRKKGDDPWQEGYQVFVKSARSFNDTIQLNPEINYHYKFYAFAGVNHSASMDTAFPATIPPPQNLTVTVNSASSVTLNWSYGLIGHEGFKIERKIDNGSWILHKALNPNQSSFTDEGLNLQNSVYHFKIFAFINLYASVPIGDSITLIWSCGDQISDIDGNTYNTVLIGNQCWMKENLKTTKYQNENPIEYPGSNNTQWANNTSGAYAWFDNDITWRGSYGALYNWYAVNNSIGLCPVGWHVPSHEEWSHLEQHVCFELGNSDCANLFPLDNITIEWRGTNEGNALKSCRQINSPLGGICNTSSHPRWNSNDTHYGTDNFNLSALPGGYRYSYGDFTNISGLGYWWSSTESSATGAWRRRMSSGYGSICRLGITKTFGISVRCVKDYMHTEVD